MAKQPIKLDSFFPYQLAKLAQRVSTQLAETYQQKFNLTIAQWRVLACLGERGAATSKIIADESFMDKVKTSRAIKELTLRGLLIKQQDEQDSRAYWLSLSQKGRVLYSEVAPCAMDWERNFLSTISEADNKKLISVFNKFNHYLDSLE